MPNYFLTGEAWLALGLILLVGEMVIGSNYVLLAFGIGALTNGGLLYMGWAPTMFTQSVLANSVFAAGLSFGLIAVIRGLFTRRSDEDINKY